MNTKNEVSRLTVDIPKNMHKRLKTISALSGKTIREIFLDAMPLIEEANACLLSDHIPNKKTVKAIKEVEESKNLIKCKNLEDLFKKLGI